MSSPTKPWEASANYQCFEAEKDLLRNQSSAPSFESGGGVSALRGGAPPPPPPVIRHYTSVPPLPPRPSFNSRPGYAGMGMGGGYPPTFNRIYGGSHMAARPYSGYGGSYSNYGNFAGGSSYSGYGGYGHASMQNIPESRLIQMAEESTRPAFESIESLVRGFGSISFMLETTYDTIYNSFRAVLDVAENVGRMRNVFSQIFSAFGLIRAMQWLYRKALYLLGFTSHINEQLWDAASSSSSKSSLSSAERDAINKKTSWGGLVLLAILCTGPYIIWKLMNSLNLQVRTQHDIRQWLSSSILYKAVTLYDFESSNDQELSFKVNQHVVLAPRELQTWGKQWLLAYSLETKKYGFVPSNYIRINETIKPTVKNTTNPHQGLNTNSCPSTEIKTIQENEVASLEAKSKEPRPLSPSQVVEGTPKIDEQPSSNW